MSESWLIIIGDIIGSRALADREGVQHALEAALAQRNRARGDLASPYTLTLGDEFQVVLKGTRYIFRDVAALLGALHPVSMRFSFAVGGITTPINPEQAIGMDGPGFHLARDQLSVMKDSGSLLSVAGLSGPCAKLVNQSLLLAGREMARWNATRFRVMERLYQLMPVANIAAELGVSDKTVYKNISAGGLHDLMVMFAEIEQLMEKEL